MEGMLITLLQTCRILYIFAPMDKLQIGAWIEDTLYMKFKELCKKRDRSMSQMIRLLIKAEVEKHEKQTTD